MEDKTLPLKLCRYRPADLKSNHFLSELHATVRGEVWLRHLGGQNDPSEGKPKLQRQPTKELRKAVHDLFAVANIRPNTGHELAQIGETRQEFRTYLKQRRKWQEKFLRTPQQKIRISSFSRSGEEDEHYMWHSYANQASGYRLEYERTGASEHDNAPIWAKIHYFKAKERRRISEFELLFLELVGNGFHEIAKKDPDRWFSILLALSACKTDVWSKEAELRLVSYSRNSDGYAAIPGYRLSGVTFGACTPLETVQTVKAALGTEIDYQTA